MVGGEKAEAAASLPSLESRELAELVDALVEASNGDEALFARLMDRADAWAGAQYRRGYDAGYDAGWRLCRVEVERAQLERIDGALDGASYLREQMEAGKPRPSGGPDAWH